MHRTVSGFDWDDGNREKCQKHGVSIREIEGLFAGPVMVLPDAAHSTTRPGSGPLGRAGGDATSLWSS
jgi:uncharacterized DUF497 family protein